MHEPVHEATWAVARARARGLVPRLASERVAVRDADRRTLSDPVVALGDLPGFDCSAMDGWAVSGPGPWTVLGAVHAGDHVPLSLAPGAAVLISTGALVPPGSDAILRTEAATVVDGKVSGPASPRDIRTAGEECRVDDVLAEAGTVLTPPLLGLIAASGHDTVAVTVRPRISLVLLGNELAPTGIPHPGRVRDALGPQVPAWLERAGAEVVASAYVPDRLDPLCEALVAADGDVIVSTGGTAAGARDYLRAAIARIGGRIVVDEVAVRPGHPMLLAVVRDRPVVALPGNPQAAVVALLTLGFPLIDTLLGRPVEELARAVATADIEGLGDREWLVPGNVGLDGFTPARRVGPAMMRGLAVSTGYAIIPRAGVRKGDPVGWLALP